MVAILPDALEQEGKVVRARTLSVPLSPGRFRTTRARSPLLCAASASVALYMFLRCME